MSANSKTTTERLARGTSNQCAHSHHDRCIGGECTCECHANPEAWARKQANFKAGAQRAWQKRRGLADGEGQDQGQGQGQGASSPAATGETAPKRPEVKSGAKAAVPAAAARQIKSEFALVLWAADVGAAKAVPQYWNTPEDRLQDDERTALVNATYNELERRAPKLLKYLAKAQESATEAVLIYTIAMIAAPRLARHGVIPPELASAIVFAPIIIANVQQSVTPDGPAATVGAEPASQPDRANGYGQIDTGEPAAPGAPIQVSPPEQTGFSDLRHGPGDPHSSGNGRYAP